MAELATPEVELAGGFFAGMRWRRSTSVKFFRRCDAAFCQPGCALEGGRLDEEPSLLTPLVEEDEAIGFLTRAEPTVVEGPLATPGLLAERGVAAEGPLMGLDAHLADATRDDAGDGPGPRLEERPNRLPEPLPFPDMENKLDRAEPGNVMVFFWAQLHPYS